MTDTELSTEWKRERLTEGENEKVEREREREWISAVC